MTTPAFIAWLEGKMAAYAGKLIPPDGVLLEQLDGYIEAAVRAEITERILREAGVEDQIAATVAGIERPTADALAEVIRQRFEHHPDSQWRDHVREVARRLDRDRD
jgi:hypothetical protein